MYVRAMGYSWVLSGHIEMNAKDFAAFRNADVEPARYEWPDSWGAPNEDEAWDVDAIVSALDEGSDAKKIEWTNAGVKLLALFSNDSSVWLDLRSHIASLVHVAAEHGGAGEIAITGYLDGGPDEVYRVATREKKPTEMEVLTARAAKPIAERMFEEVEPLVTALVDSLQPKVAVDLPKALRAVHVRVCKALREHAGDATIAKALRATPLRVFKGSKFGRAEELFPGDATLDAIENGWDRIDVSAAAKLAPFALRLLAVIDMERAREIAPAYIALKPGKNERAFVDAAAAEARAIMIRLTTPKECMSALKALRHKVPKAPHFMLHGSLPNEPAVRALCERGSATLRDEARELLVELAGKPPTLKKLSGPDQVYVYALTIILDELGTTDDRAMLFRIWTDSSGFLLLDHGRVMRSSAGKAFMASLYGRKTSSEYASQEQQFAAQQLLAHDPKRALEITKKLVAANKRAPEHEFALSSLFETLSREKKPRSDWLGVLAAAQKEISDAGVGALAVRIAWKQAGASAIVVERLVEGHMDVEQACELLERAKDESVRKKLEAHMATLPNSAKRERNRLAQCVRALS